MLDSIISFAFRYDKKWLIRFLYRIAPDKIKNYYEEYLRKGKLYYAFDTSGGDLKHMKFLVELFPNNIQDLIGAPDHFVLSSAATFGHLHVIQYLEQLVPNQMQDMIRFLKYYPFEAAAEYGHLNVLKYLVQQAPDDKQRMIKGNYNRPFRWACENGHLPVVQYLTQEATPEVLHYLLTENDYYALRQAKLKGAYNVVNFLLTFTPVLRLAVVHNHEYQSLVRPYVDTILTTLRAQKAEFEQRNPNVVFNVNEEQAKHYHCCLGDLIRRTNPVQRDDILFLLNIPSVKALVHTDSNRLLVDAMSYRNREAVELLLDIPAVRQLAQANNYYQRLMNIGLQNQDLAQDRESSMRALTTGEQKRIDLAQKHYNSVLDKRRPSAIMTDLRAELERRYLKNPASIMLKSDQNKEIKLDLPVNYEEFSKLELTGMQKEDALKAYYKHKDHSALRYLSKPNRWMHPNASYVNVDPNDNTQRWSTFDEYQPLIALLYVAATDEETPAIEGHTIASRFDHFIDELGLIGRAHNWDKSRAKGKSEEEYDDLEGDKPSCFSGVKRRLFQSVLGHPLLTLLSSDIIKSELRDFGRTHFQQALSKTNRIAIKAAWDKVLNADDLSDAERAELKKLDISTQKQGAFIRILADKYKEEFSLDPSFRQQVEKAFKLASPKDSHACSSAFASTYWWELIDPRIAFSNSLSALKKKQTEYLVNYPLANEEAKKIINELTEKEERFYKIDSPSIEQFNEFKTSCITTLHQNSSALKEHRAILGAFFAAIKQFFVALKAALFNEPIRHSFFNTQTATGKMIDELELDINGLSIG